MLDLDTAPQRPRKAQESGHHLLHKASATDDLRAMVSSFLKDAQHEVYVRQDWRVGYLHRLRCGALSRQDTTVVVPPLTTIALLLSVRLLTVEAGGVGGSDTTKLCRGAATYVGRLSGLFGRERHAVDACPSEGRRTNPK